jgi:SPP1 family phage portal protein
MITEMDRIKMIIAEGAKKGLVLSKFIDLQIDDFKKSDTFKEMVEGSKYYKNQGDIEDKQRIIIAENGAEQVAPHAKNYKLKHPIIYKMINQKAGYLLRKKPTIKQVLAKNENEDEEYKDLLKDLFNNKMHKRLKYTLIEAVKRGIAWWQIYIDENGDLKARLRYATRIIPLWQDEEHEILDAIIMTYEVEVYTSETERDKKTKVEYWDLDGVRYYIYDGSTLQEDVEEVDKRSKLVIGKDREGTSIVAHFELDGKPQRWKKIPFIYFKYNGDEMPLIHLLKSLIDCYDELCSRTGDSIYEAPDGVNVVKNYQSEAGTFQKNLATYNTVFLDTDGEYDRKDITLNIEAFKSFIEQLRKDIYEGGSCVDTQSEKFGTQESGVALKQLYADLDLDCSNIETEFKSSLEYFMFFYNNWVEMSTGKDYSDKEVEYVFNKTMTVNEKELIENCQASIEMLSQDTILSRHPYVNDVEDEKEKIDKEEKAEAEKNESDYNKIIKELGNKTEDGSSKVGDK